MFEDKMEFKLKLKKILGKTFLYKQTSLVSRSFFIFIYFQTVYIHTCKLITIECSKPIPVH